MIAFVAGCTPGSGGGASAPAPAAPGRDLGRYLTGGRVLTGTGGACAAKYRVENRRLSWFIDDACALEQVSAILPEVAGYAAGIQLTGTRLWSGSWVRPISSS